MRIKIKIKEVEVEIEDNTTEAVRYYISNIKDIITTTFEEYNKLDK